MYNSYQIAEIIGVNVSTIKRWTDSGKLQCYQTVGGHRKFHLNHISKFIKDNKKSSYAIDVSKLIGKNKYLIDAINTMDEKYLIKYSYKTLIEGDKFLFLSLNNALILKSYPIHFIFDKIIIPVLIKIGRDWNESKLSITEEHLASEIIRHFLSNLNYYSTDDENSYNAFTFTLINDKHDLPVQMTEVVLSQNSNIKTFNLGSNLPVADFINLSKKIHPDFIVISIVFIDNLKIINQEINALCKHFEGLDTNIFLRGSGVDKISLNYSNYSQINTFASLDKSITKLL